MDKFSLEEIAGAVRGRIVQGDPALVIERVCTDTRQIVPGSLFVALKGERFDAHDFLEEAAAKGAGALLVSRTEDCPPGTPTVLVRNTLQALQNLAGFNRRKAGIPVVAVTGSVGKTSTKDMIAAVLSEKFSVLKTGGNYNNEIGLPLTLLNLGPEHQVAVVEMGMRGLGEIRELAAIAQPDVGIISNIGETHLELLGSVENIARAKGELLECLPRNGTAILNGDDPWLRRLGAGFSGKVVYFGLGENCAVRATEWHAGERTTEFTVEAELPAGAAGYTETGRVQFQAMIPALGRHNVLNALAAVAAGLQLGVEPRLIIQGLSRLSLSAMRLEIRTDCPWVIINDTYNANPASMRAALEVLAEYPCKGKRVAVLGNMFELGAEAEHGHRSVGEAAAHLGTDLLITLGEQAAWIAEEAAGKGLLPAQAVVCLDKEQVIRTLKERLNPGDVVLVKGSRGMKMEEIAAKIAE